MVLGALGDAGENLWMFSYTKLRSILLMEADLNAADKLIYGVWMLPNDRKYQLMPEEVFSERNHLMDYSLQDPLC